MRIRILFLVIFMSLIKVSGAQSLIKITIESGNKAVVDITVNGQKKEKTEDLSFADGQGKIVISNKTKEDVSIDFIGSNGTPLFKIPSAQIKKKANDADSDAITEFSVDKEGKLSPALPSGTLVKGSGIIVKTTSGGEVAKIAPGNRVNDDSGNDVDETVIQTETANDLRKYVEKQIARNNYTYIGGQNNLIIDDKGIIHIYLDENGNPIYSYFPVAAKENYDKFQIHVISTGNYSYVIASTGEFSPTPIANEVETGMAKAQSDGIQRETKIYEYKSSIFGPYTGTFPFTIRRKSSGEPSKLILDRTIRLLKTSRVSVNTGVVSTWLRSPENITTFVMPSGDTTLVSDNPAVRGYLALMLTFHLKPRNLNIQPRNGSERLGISVGTNLSSNAFNNFFLGLNVEVTNGLFFNFGGHFGQVNHVVNHPDDFKYGNDKFSGELVTKKKWDVGPYLAVNIDAALFAKVFKNILAPAAGTSE